MHVLRASGVGLDPSAAVFVSSVQVLPSVSLPKSCHSTGSFASGFEDLEKHGERVSDHYKIPGAA